MKTKNISVTQTVTLFYYNDDNFFTCKTFKTKKALDVKTKTNTKGGKNGAKNKVA